MAAAGVDGVAGGEGWVMGGKAPLGSPGLRPLSSLILRRPAGVSKDGAGLPPASIYQCCHWRPATRPRPSRLRPLACAPQDEGWSVCPAVAIPVKPGPQPLSSLILRCPGRGLEGRGWPPRLTRRLVAKPVRKKCGFSQLLALYVPPSSPHLPSSSGLTRGSTPASLHQQRAWI
jgi:hypothetical protein